MTQSSWRASAPERALKRAMDVLGAAMGLSVATPLLLAIGIVVSTTHRTWPLFSQRRAGYRGKPFTLYKFRTMTDARNADGTLASDEERLTALGRWLRSTSLDELPELFNVLRGDMSIVGPRPLLIRYLDRYSAEQARRHDAPVGLTGLAQVSGRNSLTWDDKLGLDVWYVDHWSLGLDVDILWRTVLAVIRRDGISADGEATMGEFMGSRRHAAGNEGRP